MLKTSTNSLHQITQKHTVSTLCRGYCCEQRSSVASIRSKLRNFVLTSPFTVAEVQAATDLCALKSVARAACDSIISTRIPSYSCGNMCESAGVCRFFARRGNRVFVYMSPLELSKSGGSYRCFRMIGANDFMAKNALQNLHIPAFTSAESAKIICLL